MWDLIYLDLIDVPGSNISGQHWKAFTHGPRVMDKVQILIAGIPASGKSTFGKWLAKTHGFIHVDMELPQTDPSSLRAMGLESEWD
jgi:hypothetical protein